MHLPKKCFRGDSVRVSIRVPYRMYQGSYRETFVEIYMVSRNDFKGFYKKPR